MLQLTLRKEGFVWGFLKQLDWKEDIVFKDADGSFLMVKGTMVGLKWTLVEIYAPHTGREGFFSNLVKKIDQHAEGNLILMGDFNVVINIYMDESAENSTHSTIPQVFRNWLTRNGITDMWRVHNRSTREGILSGKA